jgi:hypothetical protein
MSSPFINDWFIDFISLFHHLFGILNRGIYPVIIPIVKPIYRRFNPAKGLLFLRACPIKDQSSLNSGSNS